MPMSSIETLRREYPGDPAWAHFAAVFSADAVIGMFGREGAAIWLDWRVGVLDGQSPFHILSTHPAGCRIVRHALMRMP